MRASRGVLAFAVLTLALSPSAARSAVVTVVNADGPGEGFNDPTPATPVGGNTGTTVGQQRLTAFQRAADIWGALLDSPVEIRIHATFDPLTCSANSAALGQAHPDAVVSDFPGAPPGVWYPIALANRLAGEDLAPTEDIVAQFNSQLGQAGCLDGAGWYYGLDDAHGDQIDLVTVLLHEFGHGLGFLTIVDETTGAEFQNRPDVWEFFLLDSSTNKHWIEMTPGERVASAVNTDHLVWDGPGVLAAAPEFLGPLPVLTVDSPAAIAGDLAIGTASFGAPLSVEPVSGELVQALDASDAAGAATTDACSSISNASSVAGKIALVDRGTCTFVEKALHVQAAGAIGMVVADNVSTSIPPAMGGDTPSVTIPCVSVTQADGTILKGSLPGGVTVSLRANPRRLSGAGALNRLKLYAPNPDEPGSSVSHWDVSATPNLLMEPNINGDLGHGVDLTLPLFRDIGWKSDAIPPPAPRASIEAVPAEHSPRPVERP